MNHNRFSFWQELDSDSWVQELDARLSGLNADERRAAVAMVLPEAAWREQLEEARGPLARVPVAVKDLFDVRGYPTGASSRFWAEKTGRASADAEMVRRIRAAGGIIVAKSHLNEFAYGLSGENAHFGNCPHPTIKGRLSGGSSSGSAFLTGRGVVPLALGTDTGGSIRVPASYCGLSAWRSIPGFATEGCLPLASPFDTMGFFVSDAIDLGMTLSSIEPERLGLNLNAPGIGLCPPQVADGFAWPKSLEAEGFPVDRELSGELFSRGEEIVQAFTVIQSAKAYAFHRPWLEVQKEDYDPAVYARIRRGADWTEAQLEQAMVTLEWTGGFFKKCFEKGEAVALPAAPTIAPRLDECNDVLRRLTLAFTAPASLAGLPSMHKPLPGLAAPRGLQVLFPVS